MPDEIQGSEDQIAVNEFLSEKRSLDDLTEAQMEIAMQQNYNQESTPADTVVTPEPVVEQKTQAELATEVDPQHETIRKLQVELNQAKQKEKTADDRLARFKTDETYREKELGIKKDYTYDKDRDQLDTEYLGKIEIQEQQIAELRQESQDRKQRDLDEDDRIAANKANDALFSDINKVQEEFPSLKTSIPFREFNEEYNTWSNRMSTSGKDVNKYMSDETYRNSVDAEGLAPNLQLNDISNGLSIYNGVHKMNEDIEAGYKSDFTRAFKETEAYKSAYNSKYRGPELADEQALNNRVNDINSQAQIMRPNEGVSTQDTDESLLRELDNPNITDERFEEINQFLMSRNQYKQQQG